MSKPKRTKKEEQPSDPVQNLTPRKAKYVAGVAEGKSKKAAALEAGYAETTAENARAKIESPDVLAAFQQIVQKACPSDLLAQKIAEGLEATEVKHFSKDGEVIETREVIDWSERRQYAELAVKFGGYHIEKSKLELDVTPKGIAAMTDEQLAAFCARLELENAAAE